VQVYTLTALTRTANANRRVVIQGIDIPARGLMIAGLAAIPALIATVIAWAIVGELGILMLPIIELAAFWLIETRSRSGLRLRRYQTFYDQHRSIAGTFVCCGAPIDPLHGTWATVAASSTPALLVDDTDPAEDVFAPVPNLPSNTISLKKADRRHSRSRSKTLPHGNQQQPPPEGT